MILRITDGRIIPSLKERFVIYFHPLCTALRRDRVFILRLLENLGDLTIIIPKTNARNMRNSEESVSNYLKVIFLFGKIVRVVNG